jgi:spore germination protein YaaH
MKFYTKEYLENLSKRGTSGTRTFSYAVNENKNKTSFDIFLSHSFKDKKYIEGLYTELSSKGYSVYVDWIIDADLQRTNVSKTTVNRIRMRMKQSKSLIYATSENASTSKWMPWELGFMDGDTNGKCAILPITDYENSSFNGQEFLSVYPKIGQGTRFYDNDLDIQGLSGDQSMKSWMSI